MARDSNKQMTPQMAHIGNGDGEFVFLPLSIPTTEIAAVLDAGLAEPAANSVHGQALLGVQDRARKRAKRSTRFSDFIEAYEALDYRYSTQPAELAKVWEAKLSRFQENAARGEALAMAALYFCYLRGLGTDENPVEAGKWARKAYDTGHPAGMHVLGEAFLGPAYSRNVPAADSLFRKALDADFPLTRYLQLKELRKRFSRRERLPRANSS